MKWLRFVGPRPSISGRSTAPAPIPEESVLRKSCEVRPRNIYSAPEAEEGVKVREVIRILSSDGWFLARQRGSHRHFRHPGKPGLVTVAGKSSDDLAPGTLHSIFKQARLTP